MSPSSNGNDAVHLSRRELEIARLVAEGLTNREIATRLYISERTVDGHLEHVREKLAVNSRAQIATWVTRQPEAAATSEPVPLVTAAPGRRIRVSKRWWLTLSAVALVAVEAAIVLTLIGSQGPSIITVAGRSPTNPEIGFFSGDGGPATAAVLSLPSDVAVAGDGTVYIADYRNNAIRRVAGGIIGTWAGRGKDDLQEGEPGPAMVIGHASNIALDNTGRLYMLTNWNSVLEVWSVDPGNQVMHRAAIIGPSALQFGQYWPPPVGGIAVGPQGTLYIADRAGNAVYSFTIGDAKPMLIAGTGTAGFNGDGPATGVELDRPGGLAVDTAGNLFIADSGNNRIRKVTPAGILTTVAGGGGKYYGDSGDGGIATAARLSFPFGVAIGHNGGIFIADTGNNRIREVLPSGIIVAIAGTGTAGYLGDGGPATSAELAAPEGLAVDGKGNLFFADTVNLRVREIVGVAR